MSTTTLARKVERWQESQIGAEILLIYNELSHTGEQYKLGGVYDERKMEMGRERNSRM